MFRFARWVLPVATLVFTAGYVESSSAQDAPATTAPAAAGAISGAVSDASGDPVEGATVKLVAKPAKVDRADRAKRRAERAEKATKGKGERRQREFISTATTGADGSFMMKDVAPGEYIVIANVKGQGVGRGTASLQTGGTVDVKLTLAPRQGSKRKAKGDVN